MNRTNTIAIIPARGGSKRFPGKNVALLNGISLLEHSIVYAKQHSHIIEKIVVSTDDPEIKRTAVGLGVEVIDRPSDLATDAATTLSVLQHALECLEYPVENVILLQVTNPLRPKGLLKDAFALYSEKKADSLMTVTRNHQKFGKIVHGKFVPFNYEIGQRSQDLEPLYFENGLLYITRAALLKTGKILGEDHIPFIVDHPYASIDIDTQQDLDYADFILKHCKDV